MRFRESLKNFEAIGNYPILFSDRLKVFTKLTSVTLGCGEFCKAVGAPKEMLDYRPPEPPTSSPDLLLPQSLQEPHVRNYKDIQAPSSSAVEQVLEAAQVLPRSKKTGSAPHLKLLRIDLFRIRSRDVMASVWSRYPSPRNYESDFLDSGISLVRNLYDSMLLRKAKPGTPLLKRTYSRITPTRETMIVYYLRALRAIFQSMTTNFRTLKANLKEHSDELSDDDTEYEEIQS
ncbi:hypothetical protein M501DRAFT_1012640 [Patellaria atrata CBS 101060]|uniref:Uncharacterized protein n=1 Tax=Patellaria atrata CBS 101060 TaxID=1346257 RepID=A0A9P4VTL6_9PEZI|nr:hypothetical protein M501DRAFT_1012640 [Patellaria atrata CBS 101060]